MGRISGNQEITLTGRKLSNGNIIVYFILGSKYAQISGLQVIANSSTNANNFGNKSIYKRFNRKSQLYPTAFQFNQLYHGEITCKEENMNNYISIV